MSRRTTWFVAAALSLVAFVAAAISANWLLAAGMVALCVTMLISGLRETR